MCETVAEEADLGGEKVLRVAGIIAPSLNEILCIVGNEVKKYVQYTVTAVVRNDFFNFVNNDVSANNF